MRITFLSPRLPPAVCGVADHTRLLAEAMLSQGVEVGFIHSKPQSDICRLPGPVDFWEGDRKSLVKLLDRQRADCMWVQLSGYGYSRWGAPFVLGQAISHAQRQLPRLRVAVYAHETYCALAGMGIKGPAVVPWQRLTIRRIAQSADVVFSSNPAQFEHLTAECGVRDKTFLLPIGSNVPAVALVAEERSRLRRSFGWGPNECVAVTFGSWGSQLAALRRHEKWVRDVIETGWLDRVACVGGNSPEAPAELREQNTSGTLKGRLSIFGPREAADVSRILGCCNLGLVEPTRPRMCKSSGFVAMAVNGLPVLTVGDGDPGHGLNGVTGCLTAERLLTERRSQADLVASGDELRDIASRTFGWDAIAERALEKMCGNVPPEKVAVTENASCGMANGRLVSRSPSAQPPFVSPLNRT